MAQVRDEYRMDVDWGRGGFGHIKRQALAERQAALLHQHRMYGEGQDAEAPAGEPPQEATGGEAAGAGGGSAARVRGPDRGSDSDDEANLKRRRRSDSDSDD